MSIYDELKCVGKCHTKEIKSIYAKLYGELTKVIEGKHAIHIVFVPHTDIKEKTTFDVLCGIYDMNSNMYEDLRMDTIVDFKNYITAHNQGYELGKKRNVKEH